MQYIKYNIASEAIDRTRQAWRDRIGRSKRPQDVTEFLWSVLQRPGVSHAIVAVDEATKALLTSPERNRLLEATAPDVRTILDQTTRP